LAVRQVQLEQPQHWRSLDHVAERAGFEDEYFQK
jgi:hypothetical protein